MQFPLEDNKLTFIKRKKSEISFKSHLHGRLLTLGSIQDACFWGSPAQTNIQRSQIHIFIVANRIVVFDATKM